MVDASVLVNALADDGGDGDRARARLAGEPSLHAPELLDLEVLSVLRRRAAAGHLDSRSVALSMADPQDLPLQRYPHLPLLAGMWRLRHNVSVYDGAYLALAELLECPFLTADARLATVPDVTYPVEVLAGDS